MSNELVAKLKAKPDYRMLLLNAPDDMAAKLTPIPTGAELTTHMQGEYHWALVFVRNIQDVDEWATKVLAELQDDGVLWFAYPKKTAKVETDINRDRGWDVLQNAGYRPVSQVSIDDTWSALRFRAIDKVKTK